MLKFETRGILNAESLRSRGMVGGEYDLNRYFGVSWLHFGNGWSDRAMFHYQGYNIHGGVLCKSAHHCFNTEKLYRRAGVGEKTRFVSQAYHFVGFVSKGFRPRGCLDKAPHVCYRLMYNSQLAITWLQ